MRLGRRQLLQASLGVGQLALLDRVLGARSARAQSSGATNRPDKLVTIFMPGGWMSSFAFCPLTPEQISAVIPARDVDDGEPVFFDAEDVVALDGSGSASAGAIRTPRLWDEAALLAGNPDAGLGGATSSNGWSWVHHQLWENTVVVHGVDQMTVAHVGGTISSLTGVAASDFKSPSVQAWAAHALAGSFPERALPSVWIDGPRPAPHALAGAAAPLRVPRASALSFLFSDRRERPWDGLRASELASPSPPVSFAGAPIEGFAVNPIEDRVSRRYRSLGERVTGATQSALAQIHDQLAGTSKLLARDVTSVIEATTGHEHTPVPFWATDRYRVRGDNGDTWEAQLDLALRMLKSDLVTSVAIEARGPGNYGFDSGHSDGHRIQFAKVRGTFEIIGRFLGEMKATPGSTPGKSLLDETLVLLLSDFARTWPNSGPTSDHWAANSVAFVGGGLNANTSIGGYDVDVNDPGATGYDGVPIPIIEAATGDEVVRRPRSADIVSTALSILGVEDVRIPNGNGEIVGVRG